MPRSKGPIPSYRKCSVHGNLRAVVSLTDTVTRRRRSYYLGAYGSPESREKYLQVVAQWESRGRRLPDLDNTSSVSLSGPTIIQLCHAFWTSEQNRYCPQHRGNFKACIKLLCAMYGETAAGDFGPKALRLLRGEMVRGGDGRRPWTRKNVNRQVGLVRQIFKWGVSHEMVSVAILEALRTIEPLRRGHTEAPEAEPVRPVPEHLLKETLMHLNRPVRAIVELQLLTGARPKELLLLRPCDFVTDEHSDIWFVYLDHHKTAHRGRDRTLYFGPRAQEIIRPFLVGRSTTAYMFSPAEAEEERRIAMHAARRTPLSYGNRPGTNKSNSPKRPPGDRYDTGSYRRAIQYACDRAYPPPAHLLQKKGETKEAWKKRLTSKQRAELKEWQKKHRWHPYQLRHNAATALRRQFGLEAAQLILGHSSAQITDAVYADRDREKIMGIVKKSG